MARLEHLYARRRKLLPALSVRGDRYAVIEGKTPEISVPLARGLLASVNTSTVVARRESCHPGHPRLYVIPRGAAAKLCRRDFYDAGDHQWMPALVPRHWGGASRVLDYFRAAKH
jgi:hypothetical protein